MMSVSQEKKQAVSQKKKKTQTDKLLYRKQINSFTETEKKIKRRHNTAGPS